MESKEILSFNKVIQQKKASRNSRRPSFSAVAGCVWRWFSPRYKIDLEGLVSLCKRRGFVFPSGEVRPLDFTNARMSCQQKGGIFHLPSWQHQIVDEHALQLHIKADSLLIFDLSSAIWLRLRQSASMHFHIKRSNDNEFLKSHRFIDTISMCTCRIPIYPDLWWLQRLLWLRTFGHPA